MYLRSVTLRGFKSFPDRTRLEFAPGVSVIVGPNGSGKSNIAEAVLWAMGEQSALAVRGQTMRDVIFAGGHGLPSRSAAEVELVLADADGAAGPGFSELSIARRLERSGDGEYRMNGARCRLVDVLEALSDTGLGREMHSVVSQGQVEAIVHSRPRDRRLLVEEAAGLGKHRRRRRRAELKLERTRDNLSRALDVEREARSRLRPLKRQAEAAEQHERLERASLEARLELAADAARAAGAEVAGAEAAAAAARAEQAQAERLVAQVAARRGAAEEELAGHARAREALAGRVYAARSAVDRIGMRAERARETAEGAVESARRRRVELEALAEPAPGGGTAVDSATQGSGAADHAADGSGAADHAAAGGGAADHAADGGAAGHAVRIAALERELDGVEADRRSRVEVEVAALERELERGERREADLSAAVEEQRGRLRAATARADAARAARRDAERALDAARARAARAGAELASANAFLGAAAPTAGGATALGEGLRVEPGYELALAAVLGPRLTAGVVADLPAGEALLDRAGESGGAALIAPTSPEPPAEHRVARSGDRPPIPGAERLLDRVRAAPELAAIAARLLAGAWVVDDLGALPPGFAGVAVTRAGRALVAPTGELRQAPPGGADRMLAELGRREELVAASDAAAADEAGAAAALERAGAAAAEADAARDRAEAALRAAGHELGEAVDARAALERRLRRAREAPDEGAPAVRRARIEAELAAERRLAERFERERAARAARMTALRAGIERDRRLAVRAERAAAALEAARDAVAARREGLVAALAADDAVVERTTSELRACAGEEVELQARLRRAGESVTAAEVRAQGARDVAAEAGRELAEVGARLGPGAGDAPPAAEPLAAERRAELEARVERLARRRERLGPVNPLAGREYEEARAHVEELEAQRADLESALHELERLIRDTDREIRQSFDETFRAAAGHFEEVVGHLFPGGRGRLRLVSPEGPRATLGGEPADPPRGADDEPPADVPDGEPPAAAPDDEPGVEVEVTPAGKATRRLSLLSGGEKSLVALAFLFAVFLARPCPFYILDEVEAALDEPNIDRFLDLLRRYADRAQFIVVTHQRRTMDAADRLYGVSMGGDGVSKVVSRRLGGGVAASRDRASSDGAAGAPAATADEAAA